MICPHCKSDDIVLIGKFMPDDSEDTYKCIDCDEEWSE